MKLYKKHKMQSKEGVLQLESSLLGAARHSSAFQSGPPPCHNQQRKTRATHPTRLQAAREGQTTHLQHSPLVHAHGVAGAATEALRPHAHHLQDGRHGGSPHHSCNFSFQAGRLVPRCRESFQDLLGFLPNTAGADVAFDASALTAWGTKKGALME